MKDLIIKITLIAAIAIGLSACYPGGAEYISETDIVLTNYDNEFNFAGIQTYYLADSIRHLVKEGETPDRTLDPFIISQLANNFNAIGYTRLKLTDIVAGEKPDVEVVVTVATVTTVNIYSYPWYGGWYGGYPGYGWGYPGYGGTVVSSYETGTVLWLMFDPDKVDIENKIVNLCWEGAINGLLSSQTANTTSRITTGINQAFKQSQYLSGN